MGTENQSTFITYLDGNIYLNFDTYHLPPESRGHSRLPHFEHTTNIMTVDNAQLGVIGLIACIK